MTWEEAQRRKEGEGRCRGVSAGGSDDEEVEKEESRQRGKERVEGRREREREREREKQRRRGKAHRRPPFHTEFVASKKVLTCRKRSVNPTKNNDVNQPKKCHVSLN
ncbi:hypothetical protein BHM03_00027408 [Ensete ventricosum]|nr:hypothetical protein BHM03_00027408 [Ensete ventricosum]